MGKNKQRKLQNKETEKLAKKLAPGVLEGQFELTRAETMIADEQMERHGRAWVFRSGEALQLKPHQLTGKKL